MSSSISHWKHLFQQRNNAGIHHYHRLIVQVAERLHRMRRVYTSACSNLRGLEENLLAAAQIKSRHLGLPANCFAIQRGEIGIPDELVVVHAVGVLAGSGNAERLLASVVISLAPLTG